MALFVDEKISFCEDRGRIGIYSIIAKENIEKGL